MKWLLAVGALAVGALGGWWAHAPTASPAAAAPVAAAPGAEPVTLDQMRLLLAQHALAAPAAPAAETAPARAPVLTVPAEPRPEPEHHPAAVAAVKAASDDGIWSPEDRALLRQQLTTMSEEEVTSTLASLAVAINEGRLKPEAPLF